LLWAATGLPRNNGRNGLPGCEADDIARHGNKTASIGRIPTFDVDRRRLLVWPQRQINVTISDMLKVRDMQRIQQENAHTAGRNGGLQPALPRRCRTLLRIALCTVATVLVVVESPPVSSQQSPRPFDTMLPGEIMWPEAAIELTDEPVVPPLVPCIVIDPGHGYRDYGVVGIGGTREKDVVMDIALSIQKLAQADGRIEVKLTRRGDETVSLVQRADVANLARGTGPADALVSIHVAASFDPGVTGFQVYYPGGGAGDFDIEGVFEIGKGPQHSMKRRWSRQYKEHVRDSELLAQKIDGRIDAALITRRGDARHAPLRLLRVVDMPSCLVEVGVISNSIEEVQMEGKPFRQRCAEAIYNGLYDFFKPTVSAGIISPPEGSR